jgi:hypothetical protein
VIAAYCAAVFVYEELLLIVRPEGEIVTCPAPFWAMVTDPPSGMFVSTVTVIAEALLQVIIFPQSDARTVYVVPVWAFTAEVKLDMFLALKSTAPVATGIWSSVFAVTVTFPVAADTVIPFPAMIDVTPPAALFAT